MPTSMHIYITCSHPGEIQRGARECGARVGAAVASPFTTPLTPPSPVHASIHNSLHTSITCPLLHLHLPSHLHYLSTPPSAPPFTLPFSGEAQRGARKRGARVGVAVARRRAQLRLSPRQGATAAAGESGVGRPDLPLIRGTRIPGAGRADSSDGGPKYPFPSSQAHFARAPLPMSDYVTDLKSVLDQALRVLQARSMS